MNKGILNELLDDIKEGMEGLDNNIEDNSLKVIGSNKTIETFDYSLVDSDTAEYLREKEMRIVQIQTMAHYVIGKELKEVHGKLANNKTGTFGKWCKSIGISRRSAENYIQAFNYIAKNFRNIKDAENIQRSLLFAISKPSAPLELQEAVIAGDITTYKEYTELEKELKEAKKQAEKSEQNYKNIKENYSKLKKVSEEHYEKTKDLEDELENIKSGLTDDTEIASVIIEKVPDEVYDELESLRRQNSVNVMNNKITLSLKFINNSFSNLISNLLDIDNDEKINIDCNWELKNLIKNMNKIEELFLERLGIELNIYKDL